MRYSTINQIFASVPDELFTKRMTARLFNKSDKPLGEAEVTLCRNGDAYWVKGSHLYCGRIIEGEYEGNEGA
jgi:hypothetical protein